jgi:hypothetical protein
MLMVTSGDGTEKVRYWQAKCLGNLKQSRSADPVCGCLIFLHLLKR